MMRLRVVTFQVEDALTGEVLHPGVFCENYAEELCEKIGRKTPTAFVRRVEAS